MSSSYNNSLKNSNQGLQERLIKLGTGPSLFERTVSQLKQRGKVSAEIVKELITPELLCQFNPSYERIADIELTSSHPLFDKINSILKRLELLPKKEVEPLTSLYQDFIKKTCSSSDAARLRHLMGSAKIEGNQFSTSITQELGQQISSVTPYHYTNKSDDYGTKTTATLGDLDFERGFSRSLQVGTEYAFELFISILSGKPVSPREIIKVKDLALFETPPTKDNETFVKDTFKGKRDSFTVQAKNHENITNLQELLTKNVNLNDISIKSLSEVIIASLIMNPTNLSFSTFYMKKNKQEKWEFCRFGNRGILAPTFTENEEKKVNFNLRNSLLLVPQLMKHPIGSKIVYTFRKAHVETLTLEWLKGLKQWNLYIENLLKIGVVDKSDVEKLQLILPTHKKMVHGLFKRLSAVRSILKKKQKITLWDLFTEVSPLTSEIYQEIRRTTQDQFLRGEKHLFPNLDEIVYDRPPPTVSQFTSKTTPQKLIQEKKHSTLEKAIEEWLALFSFKGFDGNRQEKFLKEVFKCFPNLQTLSLKRILFEDTKLAPLLNPIKNLQSLTIGGGQPVQKETVLMLAKNYPGLELTLGKHGHFSSQDLDALKSINGGSSNSAPFSLRFILDKEAVKIEKGELEKGLYQAILKNRLTLAASFAKAGANPNANIPGKGPLIHLIAKQAKTRGLRLLIDQGADYDKKNGNQETPLHLVAKEGAAKNGELLITRGAKLNPRSLDGSTPLHLAVLNGNKEMTSLLLAKGADPSLTNSKGENILHHLVKAGVPIPLEFFQKSLEPKKFKELVNSKNGAGETPFHIAITKNFEVKLIDSLIDLGADLTISATKKVLPPQLALQRGNLPLAKRLVEKGGNQTFIPRLVEDPKLFSELILYCWEREKDVSIAFLNQTLTLTKKTLNEAVGLATKEGLTTFNDVLEFLGGKRNIELSGQNTLLHRIASEGGDLKAVEAALASHIPLNGANQIGLTPLHIASKKGHKETVRALIKKGAAIDLKDRHGQTPLHLATLAGKKNIVEYLIKAGADIQAVTHKGDNILHLAVAKNQTDLLKFFESKYDSGISERKFAALVSHQNNEGKTPLHLTPWKDFDPLIFSDFVSYLYDPNAQDKEGNTLLHALIMGGWSYMAGEELVNYGASLTIKNNGGKSPIALNSNFSELSPPPFRGGSEKLHAACLKGDEDEIEKLIEERADPFKKDKQGRNVFHLAALSGNEYALSSVIEWANPSKVTIFKWLDEKDHEGNTPLHLALKGKSNKELAKELLSYGANPNLPGEMGNFPLHFAALSGKKDTAETLLEYGSQLLPINEARETPIDSAFKKEHYKLVVYLMAIKKGGHNSIFTSSIKNLSEDKIQDPGGFYYQEFEKLYLKAQDNDWIINKEENGRNQVHYLERMGRYHLKKGDFIIAAHLLNTTYCLAKKEKLPDHYLNHLFNSLERVERMWIEKTFKGKAPKNYKNHVGKYRSRLGEIRKEVDQTLKKGKDPKEVQAAMTENYSKLIFDIVNHAIGALPKPPPTKFALLGLGSMSRKEVSPYSDAEFAILIEKDTPQNRKYFKELSDLITLKMINLGETKYPIVRPRRVKKEIIGAKSFISGGFSMDIGGLCPQGKTGIYELIGSPKNLSEYQSEEWLEKNDAEIIMVNSMATVSLLGGEKTLVDAYRKNIDQILNSPSKNGKTIRQKRALGLLSGHINDFKPRLEGDRVEGRAFDIKQDFYRPIQMVIGSLALYYGLKTRCTTERILELERKKILSKEAATKLIDVLRTTLSLRIKTHLFYEEEKEIIYHFKDPNDKEAKGLYPIGDHELKHLSDSYQILFPLNHAARAFLTGKEDAFSTLSLDQAIDPKNMSIDQTLEKQTQRVAINPNDPKARAALQGMQQYLGDYDKALQNNLEALTLLKKQYGETTNHPDIAFALQRIGQCYFQLNDTEKASDHLFKALEMFRQLIQLSLFPKRIQELTYGMITTNQNIGRLFESAQKTEEALGFYTSSLALLRQLFLNQPHRDIGIALLSCGRCHLNVGRSLEALICNQEALKIFEALPEAKTTIELATALRSIGSFHISHESIELGVPYLERALGILEKIFGNRHHPSFLELYHDLGTAYCALGEEKMGIPLLKEALKISQKKPLSPTNLTISKSYALLGQGYSYLRRYSQAHDNYEKGLELLRKALEPELMGFWTNAPEARLIYSLRGKTYLDSGKPQLALEAFQKAININDMGNPIVLANATSMMALAHIELGAYGTAISLFEDILKKRQMVWGSKPNLVIIQNLYQLGTLYQGIYNYPKALVTFQECCKLIKSYYGKEKIAQLFPFLKAIGETHVSLGNKKEALEFFNQTLQIDQTFYGEKPHQGRVFLQASIALAYQEFGDEVQALKEIKKGYQTLQKLQGHHPTPFLSKILAYLGTLEVKTGKWKEGLNHLNQALKISKSCYKEESHPHTATVLAAIGEAYIDLKQGKKAFYYLEQALKIQESVSKTRPENGEILILMGDAFFEMEDLKQAEIYYNQAVERFNSFSSSNWVSINFLNNNSSSAWNEPDLGSAKALNKLGKVKTHLSNPESLMNLLFALTKLKKTYQDRPSPKTIDILINLACCYDACMNIGAAFQHFTQTLQMIHQVYGNNPHPQKGEAHNQIGIFKQRQGKFEEATTHFKNALETYRAFYGKAAHPDIACALTALGTHYRTIGETTKAFPLFEEAFKIQKSFFGHAPHKDIAETLSLLSVSIQEKGDKKQAAIYIEQAIKMNRQLHPNKPHTSTAKYLNTLGHLYKQQKKEEEALNCFAQAAEIVKLTFGVTPNLLSPVIFHSLAVSYLDLCQYDKAIPYFFEALTIIQQFYGFQPHSSIAAYLSSLGTACGESGDFQKGIFYASQALSMSLKLPEKQPSERTAFYHRMLGIAYRNSGNYSMASKHFEEGLSLAKVLYPSPTHKERRYFAGSIAVNEVLQKNKKKAVQALSSALDLLQNVEQEDPLPKAELTLFLESQRIKKIDARGADGKNLLEKAAEKGSKNNILFFLAMGGDISQLNRAGDTLLHLAAKRGLSAVFHTILTRSPANFVNKKNHLGQTPLHLAAQEGHTLLVRALCQKKGQTELVDQNGETPLSLALKKGQLSSFRFLANQATPPIQYTLSNPKDLLLSLKEASLAGDLTGKLFYLQSLSNDYLEKGNHLNAALYANQAFALSKSLPINPSCLKLISTHLEKIEANFFDQVIGKKRTSLPFTDKKLSELRESSKKSVKKTKSTQSIQKDLGKGFKTLLASYAEKGVKTLGKPPTSFALVGLGGLADQGVYPYSRLSYALLLKKSNKTTKKYFQNLLVFIALKVIKLGETPTPHSSNPLGFSLSSPWIGVPKEFQDSGLPSTVIFGDHSLVGKKKKHQSPPLSLMQKLFVSYPLKGETLPPTFNPRSLLCELPHELVRGLAHYHGLKSDHPLNLLGKLASQKMIDQEGAIKIKTAIGQIIEMQLTPSLAKKEKLEELYQTLVSLQKGVTSFLNENGKKPFLVSSDKVTKTPYKETPTTVKAPPSSQEDTPKDFEYKGAKYKVMPTSNENGKKPFLVSSDKVTKTPYKKTPTTVKAPPSFQEDTPKDFEYKGAKYKVMPTSGDGACALHALLGEEIEGVYRFDSQASSADAKTHFTKHLEEAVREADAPILDLFHTLISGYLSSSDTSAKTLFHESQNGLKLKAEWEKIQIPCNQAVDQSKKKEAEVWLDLIKKEPRILIQVMKQIEKIKEIQSSYYGKNKETILKMIEEKPLRLLSKVNEERSTYIDFLKNSPVLEKIETLRKEQESKLKTLKKSQIQFISSPHLLKHYTTTVSVPSFYLNTTEIKLAAILFKKKVLIVTPTSHGIEPVELINDDLKTPLIPIYYHHSHFSRCILQDNPPSSSSSSISSSSSSISSSSSSISSSSSSISSSSSSLSSSSSSISSSSSSLSSSSSSISSSSSSVSSSSSNENKMVTFDSLSLECREINKKISYQPSLKELMEAQSDLNGIYKKSEKLNQTDKHIVWNILNDIRAKIDRLIYQRTM
ncbi:tetratricopeptide repeat protein [Candidatus Neptunochlamydia vexilliferae]|nr:tetratricopeptide repeat protein [Candidatus Neptunochlamydia vexilliferae]